MHYSGILVTVSPRHLAACTEDLENLPGIEVYHRDPRGKLVVVQETESVQDQEAGFRRIGALPHVLAVELVYHYPDEDPDSSAGKPEMFASGEG